MTSSDLGSEWQQLMADAAEERSSEIKKKTFRNSQCSECRLVDNYAVFQNDSHLQIATLD